jgi:hypothetical protein
MTISFARHQFPPAVIQHAVWLYVRFTLSHYTHAMRGGEDAVKALDKAYAGSAP